MNPSRRQKQRARSVAQYAIRTGRIAKGPCAKCGTTEGRIEAHHPDYRKPLDIQWLCRKHHQAVHCSDRTRESLAVFLGEFPDMVYAEAARRLGVSRNRISQLARDLGCRRRKAGRRKAA